MPGPSINCRKHVRKRIERRIRKRLRQRSRHLIWAPQVRKAVLKAEQSGVSLVDALAAVIRDTAAGWGARADAARLLSLTGDSHGTCILLEQLFSQEYRDELYLTALSLEHTGDLHAVKFLRKALHDPNPHRRTGAARALGWIGYRGNRSAPHLARVLTDASQAVETREEAAESLAYLRCSLTITPALTSVLSDPNPGVRFWAVFALGSRRRGYASSYDPRAIPALESVLHDDECASPDRWWSVAKEALAMLGQYIEPPIKKYRDLLQHEVARVKADPDASKQDKFWADSYDD